MRKTNIKHIPLTLDLRDRLKSIVESELERLPDLLDGLNDKERLDVILKLIRVLLRPTSASAVSISPRKSSSGWPISAPVGHVWPYS